MSNIKFSGIIGREPESRYTPEGKRVLQFSVSLWTGGNKERGYTDSLWIRVEAWEALAELWADALQKGNRVTVTGTPKPPRTYKDRDGNERSAGVEVRAWEIEVGDAFKVEQDVEF
jgi:single-stranded DNA-binding protein